MRPQRLEVGLGLLVMLLVVVAVLRVARLGIAATAPAIVIGPAPVLVPTVDADTTEAQLRMLVDNNPFRLNNRPPAVDPASESDVGDGLSAGPIAPGIAPPHRRVRPSLNIRGIVGGPPWRAVVEGIPGAQPRLVSAGDSIGVFRIARVTRDSVVMGDGDTTWHLVYGGRP